MMPRTLIAVLLFFVASVSAFAQIPFADCFSGDTNPDGSIIAPAVVYDPATGILFANTLGLNQVLDTVNRTDIGGDDVGMISISVEGPEAEFLLTGFQDGIVWTGQNFNGKAQLFGVGAGAEFLAPSLRTDLLQYQTGLSAFSDFGEIEMAVNFAPGTPGGIILGSLCVIPEPSAGVLSVIGWVVMLAFLRRK